MKSVVTRLCIIACTLNLLHAAPVLRPNDVVAMCGDSITAQQMYSIFLQEYLLACQSVPGIHGLNLGAGGTNADYFDKRIQTDILPYHPTVVTVCLGMNDAHLYPVQAQNEAEYQKGYASGFAQLKAGGVRTVVVGGPGIIDPAYFKRAGSTPDQYNAALKSLSDIASKIAAHSGYPFANVYQAMSETYARTKAAGVPFFTGGDGIHPPPPVHLVMTYAFLKALGCDGNIGTISVDLASGRATGTPGQQVSPVKSGVVTVQSTRYPFCFVGDIDSRNILPYLPFNQDFNRYMLTVKGLRTPKASVTWGKTTKVFPAAELSKGINLAAEFLDNPFCDQFLAIQEAMLSKARYEEMFTNEFLRKTPRLKTQDPAQAEVLAKIASNGVAFQHEFQDMVAGRVVPITHAITIKPAP